MHQNKNSIVNSTKEAERKKHGKQNKPSRKTTKLYIFCLLNQFSDTRPFKKFSRFCVSEILSVWGSSVRCCCSGCSTMFFYHLLIIESSMTTHAHCTYTLCAADASTTIQASTHIWHPMLDDSEKTFRIFLHNSLSIRVLLLCVLAALKHSDTHFYTHIKCVNVWIRSFFFSCSSQILPFFFCQKMLLIALLCIFHVLSLCHFDKLSMFIYIYCLYLHTAHASIQSTQSGQNMHMPRLLAQQGDRASGEKNRWKPEKDSKCIAA